MVYSWVASQMLYTVAQQRTVNMLSVINLGTGKPN